MSKTNCNTFYERYILTCLMNNRCDNNTCYKEILNNKECINEELYEYTKRHRMIVNKEIYKRDIYKKYILLKPLNIFNLLQFRIFYER